MEVKVWLQGRLGYNADNDRYGLLVSDLWEHDGFRCGEGLQVKVNDEWVDTRMELGPDGWYLVDTPYRGDDLEYVSARIKRWLDTQHWDTDNMERCD